MSDIGTQLNWGSRIYVNDFYRRFLVKGADERNYVQYQQILRWCWCGQRMVSSHWFPSRRDGPLCWNGAGTGRCNPALVLVADQAWSEIVATSARRWLTFALPNAFEGTAQ